jgi:hypothetical protein
VDQHELTRPPADRRNGPVLDGSPAVEQGQVRRESRARPMREAEALDLSHESGMKLRPGCHAAVAAEDHRQPARLAAERHDPVELDLDRCQSDGRRRLADGCDQLRL